MEPICSLCGQPMQSFTQTVIRTLHMVTCENRDCPMCGLTLSDWQHQRDSETMRQTIVLTWTIEQCLAHPCPVTLQTALTLIMAEARRADHLPAEQAAAFATVCEDPVLLAELARLVQSYSSSRV